MTTDRTSAFREALDFIETRGLTMTTGSAIQLAPCRTTGDVDNYLALGFVPDRYEYEGHSEGDGNLSLHVSGVHLYCGCTGDLLDHAERVVAACEAVTA